MPRLVVRTRADSPELKKAACSIEQAAWNPLGFLNYTRAHYELYGKLLDEYADFQLCLVDEDRGYPVAAANCVPLACSGPDDLPPEGWDWVVERAEESRRKGNPNMLGALAISVPSIYRSKGYARRMIRELVALARRKGLDGVIAPVRPSAKYRHPWVKMEDYITWTDGYGRQYDPWLRSHLSSGGKLIRTCERSMVVNEHLGFWENWSQKEFDRSGEYEIEGAIAPVHIDLDSQMGHACISVSEEPAKVLWIATDSVTT